MSNMDKLFNASELDILYNTQQSSQRKLYAIDDVYAIMDIGNFRKYQEDAILITKRMDCNCELLMVADGMGGLENGNIASHSAVFETLNWFQCVDKKDFYNTLSLRKKFQIFANSLDEYIRSISNGGGTTAVVAFVLNNSVLVANIGDSRAYIYGEDKIIKITEDQSVTQELVNNRLLTYQNMRFHKQNNLILSRLGCDKKRLTIDFYEFGIDKIDYLFLFSDGVTDCISDERLEQIIKENLDSSYKKIIKESLEVDSIFNGYNNGDFYDKIAAGKDNCSVLCKRWNK